MKNKRERKETNRDEKRKEKRKIHKNAFAITTFSLLGLMILVTLSGIAIFKIQMDQLDPVEVNLEYEDYDKYYAMITSNDGAVFWQEVYTGAKQGGEEVGDYVELFAGDLGVEYSMEERMEIAIASGVDGIIVEGEDSRSLRDEITKANESGIPVVVVSKDVPDSGRISFVGISRYDLGQTYGGQTCELVGDILADREQSGAQKEDKIWVMVLASQEQDGNGQNLLMSGIREEIAKDSELESRIELEAYLIDDEGAFAAEEAIRDIFMGKEDVPDVLICLNELHTSCAYQAVIDYNKVGITNIIGYYDSETILNGVEKEVIYSTVSMDAKQMGRYCATALSEYLDTGYVSEYFTVDTYVVNQSNVKDYLGGEE